MYRRYITLLKLRMKTFNRLLCLLLPCFLFIGIETVNGQDNLQNIYLPEYTNPAYNALKDFSSINMLTRNQWGSNVVGSPETYGLDLFFPIKDRLGGGVFVYSEDLGLTSRFISTLNLTHYARLAEDKFLGFGYRAGIEHVSYDISEIYEYNPDIIIDDELDNKLNAHVAVGLFYYQPNFYTGISMSTNIANEYSANQVSRGFDFFIGKFFELKNDILIKPEFAVKYYRIKEFTYTESEAKDEWVDPIYNLGASIFLLNRIWFGVTQRFEYAQIYSCDFYVTKSIKMGYSYERGIGSGVNRFDSHVFRIGWNFWNKKSKERNGYDRPGEGVKSQFLSAVGPKLYR